MINIKDRIKRIFQGTETPKDLQEISSLTGVEKIMQKQWLESASYQSDSNRGKRMWKAIEKRRSTVNFNMTLRKAWFSAASIILLVSTMVGGAYLLGKETKVLAKAETMEVYSGGTLKYELPDHTIIWMRPDTRIKYNKDFESNREVWIEGESVFEVTHQGNNHFKVNMNGSRIEVLGTKFNVKNQAGSKETKVTLYEGSIKFSSEVLRADQLMKPGQVLLYDNKKEDIELITDCGPQWNNGQFVFQQIKAQQLINWLEEFYEVSISLDDSINPDFRITGSISFDESLQSMLYKICFILKANYQESNKKIYISKY